jgi:hypothetical protein
MLRVLALALTLLWARGATTASAFCRESLESQAQGPCTEEPGVPFLFWKRACMTYRFNDQFFKNMPLLTPEASRAIFATSFQTWAAVNCGGRKPFFVEQFAGTTKTSNAEFLYDVSNESVIAARTRTEWTSLKDHDSNALALTLLWHDKVTGEILDVDMELNTGAGRFNDCVMQRCTVAMIDLQNTITHEAGHLLGLGHSPVPGSTMEASTQSNPEVQKRMLKPDDEAGYCALKLPEPKCTGSNCTCPAPPALPSHTTVKTCSCRTLGATSQRSPGWLLSLVLLCGLGWHRLRKRQQR